MNENEFVLRVEIEGYSPPAFYVYDKDFTNEVEWAIWRVARTVGGRGDIPLNTKFRVTSEKWGLSRQYVVGYTTTVYEHFRGAIPVEDFMIIPEPSTSEMLDKLEKVDP